VVGYFPRFRIFSYWHYDFLSDGYLRSTHALIPAGLGALCANLRADFALANVLTGKLPLGAPPAGPQKSDDLTLLYLPTLDPPGFLRALRSALVNLATTKPLL